MPFDAHLGELVYADGSAAGTPVDIIGRLWAEEAIPHQAGAGFLVIELAEPVFFQIDPSRTPICLLLWIASVLETHRFGWWQITKMEGLANELDGTILSRGFTLAPWDADDVESIWQQLASPDEAPLRPMIRLHTASGWEGSENIRPPAMVRIHGVSLEEFESIDCLCGSESQDISQA